MRKKILLSRLHSEIEKNAELEIKLREAQNEISDLNEKILSITKKISEYEILITTLEEKPDSFSSLPENESETEIVPETEEIQEEIAESESAETLPESEPETVNDDDNSIDVTELEKINVNREIKYASEAIGDVVVSCAELCNEFAKTGGGEARELINLALGRTEVFKADCLTIATSDTSYSVKKECIDRLKFDTEDYFKTLSEQNLG